MKTTGSMALSGLKPRTESVVELPAGAEIISFFVIAQESQIALGPNQQAPPTITPVIRILYDPTSPAVPRRFALVPDGSTLPDDAIHVGSVPPPMTLDLFEIPGDVELPDQAEHAEQGEPAHGG